MLVCIDSANVAIGLRKRSFALDYRKLIGAVNSDFAALAKYLHKYKKKTYVLSTRGSIAKELIDESDGYVVLSEWKTVVRPYKKSPRR